MYRFAQRRVGIVAAVIIAALAIVIFAVFPGIYTDPKGGPVSALLMVVAATAVAYLVLRFAAVRAEAVLVALRVRRGKIALARIDKIEELGEARDICLTPHRLCAFETEVFVPGGESFSCRIVEDIDKRFEVKTPAWVYVTYEGEAVRIVLESFPPPCCSPRRASSPWCASSRSAATLPTSRSPAAFMASRWLRSSARANERR